MKLKGALYVLFLLIASAVCLADVQETIKLGESIDIMTATDSFTVAFDRYDSLTDKGIFKINDKELATMPFAVNEVDGINFIFTGMEGESKENLEATFFIIGIEPIACGESCSSNQFTKMIEAVYPGYRSCKEDCDVGCGLYKKRTCEGDSAVIMDACDEVIETIEQCKDGCISGYCTYCGDRQCISPENEFNCGDCASSGYCYNSSDCPNEQDCIHNQCTNEEFILGDSVCNLPSEPCSSRDCSCDYAVNGSDKDGLPIIILHGFASSPVKLRKLQRKLADDLGYINGGEVSINTPSCESYKKDTVYIATYYEEVDKREDTRIAGILEDAYKRATREDTSEEAKFQKVLAQVVDKVRMCSGSDKVDIIAHSMGGLVSMSYIAREDNMKNVNKMIFLGTPFFGEIYGDQTYKLFQGLETNLGDRKDALRKCSSLEAPSVVLHFIDGRDMTSECSQLQRTNTLNEEIFKSDQTPGRIEYHSIAGKIDEIGDGVVPVASTVLKGSATNDVVACNHFDLKDPSRCKEGYQAILSSLGYGEVKEYTSSEKVREFFASGADIMADILRNPDNVDIIIITVSLLAFIVAIFIILYMRHHINKEDDEFD